MNHLIWFRTDLRVADNPALSFAVEQAVLGQDNIFAVYFMVESQLKQHQIGPRKIQLIKNTLHSFKRELGAFNIPLLIINAEDFNNTTTLLNDLVDELDIKKVNFNIEYELNERRRDLAVTNLLRAKQIEINKFHDQLLLPPEQVKTQADSVFRVFTPFKKKWQEHVQACLMPPLAKPKPFVQAKDSSRLLKQFEQINIDQQFQLDELWQASEQSAHDRLGEFLADLIEDYDQHRDRPDLNATSQLSIYLSLGLLSPRQCFYPVYIANEGRVLEGGKGLVGWMNELIWREFYRYLIFHFPKLCYHQAFKSETEPKAWNQSDEDFAAWCQAKTGYPIVDAAILQLKQTGWMHNRLRMIVAMFLTKHLLIDWRKGEAFFNYYLLDADFASNNGGWQWSASTGADAAPYFRIFNPIRQSEKFDPQGEFICRYLPEFKALAAKTRHFPNSFERQEMNYPDPVVNHVDARERALNAFSKKITKAL